MKTIHRIQRKNRWVREGGDSIFALAVWKPEIVLVRLKRNTGNTSQGAERMNGLLRSFTDCPITLLHTQKEKPLCPINRVVLS